MAAPMGGEMMPPYEGSQMPPYEGGPPFDANGSVMPNQYPTGPAMETYNGMGAGGGPGSAAGGSKAGGSDAGSHAAHACIDKETGIAPRRCTDTNCCFCWLFFVILLLTLMTMSRWYGNVNALTHGRDYYGRICGIDSGVENLPWLYWCRDLANPPAEGVPSALQMFNPSCVAACPISYNSNVSIPCLQRAEEKSSILDGGQFGNVRTQEVLMQESIVMTKAYGTTPRGGRFCIPKDEKLQAQLLDSWDGLHPFGPRMTMVNAGTLGHIGWVFFVVTVVSILLGFLFYFLIRFCPKQLTYLFTWPPAIACAIMGIWLLGAIIVLINQDWAFSQKYQAQWNPLYQHYSWTTASILSLFLSALCWVGACMLAGMAYNFDGAIVGDLINAAMECMRTVPCMMYMPILEGFVKFLIFMFFLDGLRWFFTVGELHKNRIHVNGAEFAGLSRIWVYNTWWILCILIWVFGMCWFMEMANCFFQYCISKGTVAFYYTPKEKGKKKMTGGSPLPGAMKDALLYHFGSIAYGGYAVPLWRPYRLLYWMSSEIGIGGDNPKTCCGKVLNCFKGCSCGFCGLDDCCGIKEWSKEKVYCEESMIKDGFTDVCIRANDFEPASAKAHFLLEHSHKVVQYVYRDQSQTTLCVLGVVGIGSLGATVAFLIVNFMQIYIDPGSTLYIANPFLTVALAWILAAYIAYGFMAAWDHTADTLLMCYAWNRKFSRTSVDRYIPEAVRAIVGWDDKEDDRYPYYGRAKTNMYLRSWIPIGDKKKERNSEARSESSGEKKGPAFPAATPQGSWWQPGSWMGSQAPMPAPSYAPQEMQSLIPK